MFFYVDESGHTGPNLFDPNQPMLFYGVLSSRLNIDVVAADAVKGMRAIFGVERLHAAELGNGNLVKIAADLVRLQKKLDLRFDLYRVKKPDHAIICFFDQVFDQGVNPAMTWMGYWTPLRYVLLLKLAQLFDQGLAEMAWRARLELDDKRSEQLVSEVCHALVERAAQIRDPRARQVISDTLRWAAANPAEIHYNAKTKNDRLAVMPNIIGFQSVMIGIAKRLKGGALKASRMVVDQQSQFNKAQRTLHEFYVKVKDITLESGAGLPEVSLKGVPDIPIEFMAGTDSYGLELVDVFLWIFRRALERRELAPELLDVFWAMARRGRTDEISLSAIEERWSKWFEELPEPTPEMLAKGKEVHQIDESRRQTAMRQLAAGGAES